ncbi:class I SAM-dependent methyltransferase [Desulfobacter latus]|uniref:Methyltransferase domain-containing protein n=1 Tax=Desulfobacter latus TaxID=2292 RepID=A0A850T6H8_9BACT|nr:class I SAM-dependent methyltransferase [Desulfobacter latus]NWH04962.1 methyltransferase domain-containing protein [Desulfobacter latus]
MTISSCPLCQSADTRHFFNSNISVASDATVMEYPITNFFCESCYNIFKIRSPQDKKNIKKIYNTYVLHSIESHQETRVAYDIDKEGIEKSKHLLTHLFNKIDVPRQGRALDIGCHFGSLLRFFFKAMPLWELHGYDISERFRTVVESIAPATSYHCGNLSDVKGSFDLIFLTHVLEHIDEPGALLSFIEKRLKPDGLLFLQCNNLEKNPYLPLLFEQHFNFSLPGLVKLLEDSRLSVYDLKLDWIPKEISVIARKADNCPIRRDPGFDLIKDRTLETMKTNQSLFTKSLTNLELINAKKVPVAVFGTAYVGRWMAHILKANLRFFLDENKKLHKKIIQKVPVLLPEEVTEEIIVILAIPPQPAEKIMKRLAHMTKIKFLPPPYTMTPDCREPA